MAKRSITRSRIQGGMIVQGGCREVSAGNRIAISHEEENARVQGPDKLIWCGLILVLLMLFAGCAGVPVSSDIVVNDKLHAAPPLKPNDVLLIFGENAVPQKFEGAMDYFTLGCLGEFHKDTLGELVETIQKVSPSQPDHFSVRYVKEEKKNATTDHTKESFESILFRLDITRDVVSRDHLRYAIHVKESFETTVHVPLLAIPIGVASCGNKTVLEASVWDLQTEVRIGSLSVSADGEYSAVAYLAIVWFFPDTQKDAMDRLAREIVAKLYAVEAAGN